MSVISRVDVLLTNRLHGLVYALRSGVPPIVLDSISGGGKVSAQARLLGWPACRLAEKATSDWLDDMLAWSATDGAAAAVQESREKAEGLAIAFESELKEALNAEFVSVPLPKVDIVKSPRWRRLAGRIRKILDVIR